MLECLDKNREAIRKVWIAGPLLGEDWMVMPYLLWSVKPFVKIAEELGGQQYPTLSSTVLLAAALIAHPPPGVIEDASFRLDEVPSKALRFHEKLVVSAKERIGKFARQELLAFALDPQFVHLPWLTKVQKLALQNEVNYYFRNYQQC
jgi:hypothetical protein